jgi:phage I-like protein
MAGENAPPDRISGHAAEFAEGMNALACVATRAAFENWLKTSSPEEVRSSLLATSDRLIDSLVILAGAEAIDAVGGVVSLQNEVGRFKNALDSSFARGSPLDASVSAKECLEKIADAMGLPRADRPWMNPGPQGGITP